MNPTERAALRQTATLVQQESHKALAFAIALWAGSLISGFIAGVHGIVILGVVSGMMGMAAGYELKNSFRLASMAEAFLGECV